LPIDKYGTIGRPVLTRLLVPKDQNQRVKTVKNLPRQHADGFRKQGPESKSSPMLLFAMDSQTEVTGTKIYC